MPANSEDAKTRRRGTQPVKVPSASGAVAKPTVRQRMTYTQSFKLEVVRHSLRLPESARIKPTCRTYPGIEPVQIRKWIKNLAPLAMLMEAQEAPATTDGISTPPRSPSPTSEHTEPPETLLIEEQPPSQAPEQAPRQPAQSAPLPWQRPRFPADEPASHNDIDLALLGSDPVWRTKHLEVSFPSRPSLRDEADGCVAISRASSSTTMTPTYLSHSASPTPMQDHSWVWPSTSSATSSPTMIKSSPFRENNVAKRRRSVSLLGITASANGAGRPFGSGTATPTYTSTYMSHPASPAPMQDRVSAAAALSHGVPLCPEAKHIQPAVESLYSMQPAVHSCPTSMLAPQAVSSLYGRPYALSPLAVLQTLPHPAKCLTAGWVGGPSTASSHLVPPPAPPAPPASRHTSPSHPWGTPASHELAHEGTERDSEQAAAAQELLSLFHQAN